MESLIGETMEENWKYDFCEECYECRMKKFVYDIKLEEKEKEAYVKRQLEIVKNGPKDISLLEFENMLKVERDKVVEPIDFVKIKHYYNQKMMELIPDIEKRANDCDDAMLYTLKLALIGNYIDYGAFDKIDDDKLLKMLDEAIDKEIDLGVYQELCDDLSHANSLVYFTDNCGEVVLDKLFIKEIVKRYPDISITVIVRGKDALNDATIQDVKEIGLEEVCKVVDNGLVGTKTEITKMSNELQSKIKKADVLISKGQANAESLAGSGLNLYYIFLCKCNHFARNYQAKMFDGILSKERKKYL